MSKSNPSSHLDLEFQGYLDDKDRTKEELISWMKYISTRLRDNHCLNVDVGYRRIYGCEPNT